MNWKRRLHMHFNNQKVKLIIGGIILVLIVLSVIGLANLESFYRKITIAQLPITLLLGGVHAIIFTMMNVNKCKEVVCFFIVWIQF